MESMRAEAADAVALQVRQAWLNVQETLHRLEVTRCAIRQAEENLSITRDRYEAGNGTNTEVLDAETLRVRTLSNNDTATYDAIFAALTLQRAVGDL
jgi:outer membrane protein TolC